MMVAGPGLYLLGESLVGLRIVGSLSSRRLLTVIALGLFGLIGRHLSALALSAGVAAILAGLAIWDHQRSRAKSVPFAPSRA
jgi:hypothetical protein